MIYMLTATELTTGDSSTIHIYTQNNTQNNTMKHNTQNGTYIKIIVDIIIQYIIYKMK
jgi:hypothetical protein